VLARSAGARADYALRTLTRKAIFGGLRATDWRLYDLVSDPGETRDLMLERLDEFACLAAHAASALAPAGPRPEPSGAEPDAERREALRALGYVD
jgi:hypothetical protein